MQQTVDIESIIDHYPGVQESMVFILQDIQEAFGYISLENMQAACDHVGVPLTHAYSMATFYKSFRLEPVGEHEIHVCLGTACHLKGGPRIVDELERRLNVHAGATTEDMRYTLETVNCLGACALAPVVVVDKEYVPKVTAKKIQKTLKTITDNE
ncbi:MULTISPECIES: NADH-quinone oxidoreductase subunit NuoE [Desulfatibacillum]|jgi:NADH-quinone oxidoreductase subunit E|uniref:NADH:ubiquinone oxidoreductase 24 kD subunit, NuoE n=2 Tax=Desulfatibacillum TaxID=218207 RepID=B8FIH5_DESAL|nr:MULTISPECIES: NADH-quinone oxidoreductase subunit NuoE [Desulfatibacillum]ACL03965.1 Putative NADH:ubiquinone oxidoreductase 24 kD subunit, NuoE [Desulfatibacillum aliphaticivorans]SHL05146.1 NADH-quinone oxidoreductase subunit E [Desulfatibacillum alkenivorans DSM 16219]